MKLDLAYLLPQIRPWVDALADTSLGRFNKQVFAWWGVAHILSLIALGGSAILMNLRLLGAGVTEEPPETLYRNLRVYQNIGAAGIIITGIMLGTANAVRLYNSAAFLVKILALIAGIILTYGSSRSVAAANGAVGPAARNWFAIGSTVFLLALALFAFQSPISSGVFLIIAAAALIVLAVTKGRLRPAYLGVLAALVIGEYVFTHSINMASGAVLAAWIGAAALYQLFRTGNSEGTARSGLIAYASILVWVMAAAAGRWIAFE